LPNGCWQKSEKEDQFPRSHALHCVSVAVSNAADCRILFLKSSYGLGQPTDVSDVAMRNEDDDNAFHDWQKFSGMDNEKSDNYVSVDSHLVTSSVTMMKELCESHVGTLSMEGEDSEPKPEVMPNFAEAQEALMKVKSFVCAHSHSGGGRDSVLSLESSFFELRHKVCTKQLSITEFFFFHKLAVLMKYCNCQ
jgi:hypothetical protein